MTGKPNSIQYEHPWTITHSFHVVSSGFVFDLSYSFLEWGNKPWNGKRASFANALLRLYKRLRLPSQSLARFTSNSTQVGPTA